METFLRKTVNRRSIRTKTRQYITSSILKLTNTRVYTHSSYSANVSVTILRMANKVHCISTVRAVNISFQKSLSLQRVYKTEFDSQIISKYKRTKFITRKVRHFKQHAQKS